MIWNSAAIDNSAGLDIIDLETGIVYTKTSAREQSAIIRSRLVNRPRKIGCYVKDLPAEQKRLIKKELSDTFKYQYTQK